jgi:hypothetical protein
MDVGPTSIRNSRRASHDGSQRQYRNHPAEGKSGCCDDHDELAVCCGYFGLVLPAAVLGKFGGCTLAADFEMKG